MSVHDTYSVPPGLVGDVARFIFAAAPRPVPEIALVAAIGAMAGICGRAYNISNKGLNLYIVLVAETGVGKEAISSGISALSQALCVDGQTISEFYGPSEIVSAPALVKYLANTSQSFVTIIGEFGIALHQMTNPRAPAHLIGLKRAYLDLYGKSGRTDVVKSHIYSDREKSTPDIKSPNVSIIGETTPTRLYESMNEQLISDGFFPRFTIIEYRGKRPPLNKNRIAAPEESLLSRLRGLCAFAASQNGMNSPTDVQQTREAEAILDEFDEECDAQINSSSSEVIRHMWNRAHLKVLKLSALIAVGVNYERPMITAEHANWAIAIEREATLRVIGKFENGETGMVAGNEVRQQNEVRRVIKEFNQGTFERVEKYGIKKEMHNVGIFTHQYLQRRLLSLPIFRDDPIKATPALKRAVQNLVDGDEIEQIEKRTMWATFGIKPTSYRKSEPNPASVVEMQKKSPKTFFT